MKGTVVKNTGSSYVVRMDDGQLLNCIVKGNFRIKGIRSTSPVAIGDRVDVDAGQPAAAEAAPTAPVAQSPSPAFGAAPSAPKTFFITAVDDRRNYIIRKSINLSKQSHILAANVDQALLVVTVSHPLTSTTFIDRFLASAEAYRVPVILAFNKDDLLDDDERRLEQLMMQLYGSIGYRCLALSAATGAGLDALRPLLSGQITLLSGNSGVGKSTLINCLVPGAALRTAELSQAHHTGQHTTTFSEMIALPGGGDLIDTPGIKGFGTFDMEPGEIGGYFRDIFAYARHCRFSNCTHTHEPGCAVLQALDDHHIAQSRYQSYLSMLHDKEESKYREAY